MKIRDCGKSVKFYVEEEYLSRYGLNTDFFHDEEKCSEFQSDIIDDLCKEAEKDMGISFLDDDIMAFRVIPLYDRVIFEINKPTNIIHLSEKDGAYSFEDISVDKNCRISGLPKKLCDLLNSQESNARYEELRDNILMVNDYKNAYGLSKIFNTKCKIDICFS